MLRRPYGFLRQGIMVPWNQKRRWVCCRLALEDLTQAFPEVRARIWIIEQVARAQDRVDGVSTRNVENRAHDLQSRPGQLALRFLVEGRKAAA